MARISVFTPGELLSVVRKERKAQKISQVQLARLSNTGTRFVRDIEAGKCTVQFDKLMRVLETLGVALEIQTPSDEA